MSDASDKEKPVYYYLEGDTKKTMAHGMQNGKPIDIPVAMDINDAAAYLKLNPYVFPAGPGFAINFDRVTEVGRVTEAVGNQVKGTLKAESNTEVKILDGYRASIGAAAVAFGNQFILVLPVSPEEVGRLRSEKPLREVPKGPVVSRWGGTRHEFDPC